MIICSSALVSSGAPLSFQLEFNDPSLPSANGFTYGPLSDLLESSAYSVNVGHLLMNTISSPFDNIAYYERANAWDSSLDLELRFSAHVLPGSAPALYFNIEDGVHRQVIRIGYGTFSVRSGGTDIFSTYAAPDEFHEFVFRSAGGSANYTFLIDGIVHAGGVFDPSNGPPLLTFGDLSGGAGDSSVEIDYIRYVNSSVPEPASFGLCFLALFLVAMVRHFR